MAERGYRSIPSMQLVFRFGQIAALDERQHGEEVLLLVRRRRLGAALKCPDQSESE